MDAINSIVDLFIGQQNNTILENPLIAENGVIPNKLTIGSDRILENLKEIQERNGITKNDKLDGMDFTIEMETGTGKTYVYLRTILELSRRYGFLKFIIIVPSVAIREGVLKSLEMTKSHFKQIFDNIPYNFYEYDSSKLTRTRQFARNSNLEIMIMTLDSFNKDSNIMNSNIDRLNGQKPIDIVGLACPILILDEPQNMESEKSQEAISKLNSIFRLRYSATHRSIYNLTFRLTPVDAYAKNLVKKIEVLSVVKDADPNSLFVRCTDIIANKKGIQAKLEVFKKTAAGQKIEPLLFKNGEDLFSKTNVDCYKNVRVIKIDARYGLVEFSNGLSLSKEKQTTEDRQDVIRTQVRETILEHLRKQQLLKTHGIKVLSLFFISRVSDYNDKDGFLRKIFIEEFEDAKKHFPSYININAQDVHRGYFSSFKNDASIEKDRETFDLIMKDKERLLSFDEPTQFIFSHSALREGWDNPNIFNICTLNQTVSNLKKRQEIGRGIRLPVNQQGDRIKDVDFNILTVIANESYASYVSKLQNEYVDEYGIMGTPPKPPNAKSRRVLMLKKGFEINSDFVSLWNKISKRTRFSVSIDRSQLIARCIDQISSTLSSKSIKIRIEKVSLSLETDGIRTLFVGDSTNELSSIYDVPNVIDMIAAETNLTRQTIYHILTGINNLGLIYENPADFIQSTILIIKETLKQFLVDGIQYVEVSDFWKMTLFEGEVESYEENILQPIDKSIYNGIVWQSEGERDFARKLEEDTRVKLFLKLPRWFIVATPIGEYNPDWAIVFEEKNLSGEVRDKLFLVRETKFVDNMDNLRPSERMKVDCAKIHFKKINVDFKAIKSFEDLK